MASADLAIGAGGSTAWERCCLGLPSIVMTIADNQQGIARALADAGAAINLGPAEAIGLSALVAAIKGLASDREQRVAMARAAAALTDGLGGSRVVEALPC
jgi:spore coat polysaccharide biosynthesis predicted glycosyltransferase SpsG